MLYALIAANLLLGLGNGLNVRLISFFSELFTPALVGGAIGTIGFITIFLRLVTTPFFDRLPLRYCYVAGTILMAIGYVVLLTSPTIELFVLSNFLTVFGLAVSVAAIVTVANVTHPENRAKWVNLVTTANLLGFSLGTLGSDLVLNSAGSVDKHFQIIWPVTVAIVMIATFVFPWQPMREQSSETPATSQIKMLSYLGMASPKLIFFSAAAGMVLLPLEQMFPLFLPRSLSSEVSLFYMTVLPVVLFLRAISTRLKIEKLNTWIQVGFVALFFQFLTLGVLTSRPLVAIAGIFQGIGKAILMPSLVLLSSNETRDKNSLSGPSLVFIFMAIGNMFGRILIGSLIDRLGSPSTAIILAILCIPVPLLAISSRKKI